MGTEIRGRRGDVDRASAADRGGGMSEVVDTSQRVNRGEKKMKQHIVFVLDKSGSMETIRDRVISGFNEFLEDQKREAARRGDEVSLTLTLFDSPVYSNVLGQVGYVTAYAGENIADVPGLTKESYVPGGATALLDAIARILDEVGDCDGADRVLM